MHSAITKTAFRNWLLGTAMVLFPAAAQAACSDHAPASGSSVTCTGADTTAVIASSSDHVTLDLANGASIVPLSGPSIWLGPSANVTLEQNSITGNQAIANNYAVLLGDASTLTLNGAINSPGGITGPTQGSGSVGLTHSHIILGQTGVITTSGIFVSYGIDGHGGGNIYDINGLVDATTGGINVGAGDVVNIGATGILQTSMGTTADPISGFGISNVTVNMAAGSHINLHGIGRGIQLGTNANVTVGGAITSPGDAATTNSAGGYGVEVGANSYVHILSTGSIVTGNTSNLGNGGTGGTGIYTRVSGVWDTSTIIVDGIISTQKSGAIQAGGGDSITIGQTGHVSVGSFYNAIFVDGYTSAANYTTSVDIAGRVESGTGTTLVMQGDIATGATRVDMIANVTVEATGTLFAQGALAYGNTAGDTHYPDVIDNLTIAGTVGRGNAGTVINLNTGADTLTLLPTAVITGNIDGGSSTNSAHPGDIDTFALDGAANTTGTFDFSVNQLLNFEAGHKIGAGTWVLQGNSGAGLSGLFAVDAGTLKVNGTLSNGGATVASGATLTGSGSIGGTTTIANGGTLQGTAGQVFTLNNLILSSTSKVDVTLGAPSNTGVFHATGALTLDGQLTVHAVPSFGFGVYRLFDYDGALTDNGLTVSSLPSGYAAQVQTSVANQVNLVMSQDVIPDIQFWNGTTTTAVGHVVGGNGTWSAGSQTNWTDANGQRNDAWTGKMAVFQGTSPATTGTVTVDASSGAVVTTGMQFIGSGWIVQGASVGLNGAGGVTTVRVGDGSQPGASSTATISSVLSGAGSLVKTDLGTLYLTGANTYSGGTTISSGSLGIGNGGTSGSVTGNIVDNATLVFNRSDAYEYAGVISGTGAVHQGGAGMLTLSGNSSAFAGSTTIDSGILSVGGTLGGTLGVNAGRLQGTGTVGATTVAFGGTIAPGNSIGTLHTGAITFQTGSIYEVEANDAGQADLIASSGTATINGGTVQVLAANGNYAPETVYTIVTATGGVVRGGASNGFAGVTSNLAFLTPMLTYEPNDVLLTLVRNDLDFASIGHTFNQRSTGAGVQTLGFGAPIYDAILSLDEPSAQMAFDSLSGEIHASLRSAMTDDTRLPRNAVLSHLSHDDGQSVWIEGFGNWGSTDTDFNAADTARNTKGFVAGADTTVDENIRLGLAAGYTHTNLDVDARDSLARINSVHVIGYAGAVFDALRLSAGFGYAHSNLQTVRAVVFSGFSDVLDADYHGSLLQGFGEAAYAIPMEDYTLSPFANFATVRAHTDAFSEQGGDAVLSGAARSDTATFSTLGLRFQSEASDVLSVTANAGWRHTFGTATPFAVLAFDGSAPFAVAGIPTARDVAATDAGVTWHVYPDLSFGLAYNGLLGGGSRDNAFRVTIDKTF